MSDTLGSCRPQLAGLRMPDPDDEADRVENSGDLLEQRGDLTGLVEPAELDTETRRSHQVGLDERGQPVHRRGAGTATAAPAAGGFAPPPNLRREVN